MLHQVVASQNLSDKIGLLLIKLHLMHSIMIPQEYQTHGLPQRARNQWRKTIKQLIKEGEPSIELLEDSVNLLLEISMVPKDKLKAFLHKRLRNGLEKR